METLQIVIVIIATFAFGILYSIACYRHEKRMAEEYIKQHPTEFKSVEDTLNAIESLTQKYQLTELKEGTSMGNHYLKFDAPTKEVLDQVKVGDLIKCNDWTKPLTVKAVSENYFIMVRNHFGQPLYSICEKTPSAFSRNSIIEGYPTIGMDFWTLGKFDYFDQEDINQCIAELESGETELSVRNSCALKVIYIKRAKV